MKRYECPDHIYKFLSYNGLLRTIESTTFRLSRLADFNDPLDAYLQEAFGNDRKFFLEGLKAAFIDFIEGENDPSSLPDSPWKARIMLIHAAHENAPPDHWAQLRKEMLSIPIENLYDLDRFQRTEQEVLSFARQSFEHDGVFCSTIDFENLLMWAHYADKHRGAVIEFTPSMDKDSAFLASKPIKYSNERPVLYRTSQEMVQHGFTMSNANSSRIILDRLIYTKSRDWEYEQEYRLFVPFSIALGQSFATLKFHSEELTRIFLGCRMEEANQHRAVILARTINPQVEIYRASPKPRRFGLDFQKFA